MEIVKENITLKNSDMNDFKFQRAFANFRQMAFDVKTAYTVSYIGEHIDRHVKQGRDIFGKIAKKHGLLDEKGNLTPEMDENDNPVPGTFQFRDDEAKEAFVVEEKEFMAITHEIPKNRLDVALLDGFKMTANDVSALAPLLCGLDD